MDDTCAGGRYGRGGQERAGCSGSQPQPHAVEGAVADDGRGNCFNACVASILEMPLREVCGALPGDDGYWQIWESWFEAQGLSINVVAPQGGPPRGFAIASGLGGRFYPPDHARAGQPILHAAVVFNGELVHDPFPCAKEFGDIRYYWTIDPLCEDEREAQ